MSGQTLQNANKSYYDLYVSFINKLKYGCMYNCAFSFSHYYVKSERKHVMNQMLSNVKRSSGESFWLFCILYLGSFTFFP